MGGGGGKDTEEESAHKVDSGEESSPAAPVGIRTRNLSITSPALYQHAIPALSSTNGQYRQLYERNLTINLYSTSIVYI